MSEKQHTLCFTGHRYYSGSAEELLVRAIEAAFDEGYRVFVSGVAQGFDLAAAEAVLRFRERHLGVELLCAVPFRGQARAFSAVDKARYEAVLAAADSVVVLREDYSFRCYWERDDWMVAHSSRVICWYDGSRGSSGGVGRGAGGGGTRYTVRAALAAHLDIVNLFSSPDSLF
ncbi:MAG: DUF1273 domain-containing protein [Rikenellaceae bacterium]|jgi:uncharacterized phage-like protein YoqJ|nr:DUF1273 domain-containing protein [Rikenellaceae bacterium]